MTLITQPLAKRLFLGVVATLFLPGCQGHTIVARVDGKAINQEEFYEKASRVMANLQEDHLDAGAFTLLTMIQVDLRDALAQQNHCEPTQEAIESYLKATVLTQPELVQQLQDPGARDEVLSQIKGTLEMESLGTGGATYDLKDEQAIYEREALSAPGAYHLKVLTGTDPAIVAKGLQVARATGDFVAANKAMGNNPATTLNAGQEQIILIDRCPAELRSVLDTLPPLHFVSQPIPVVQTVQQRQVTIYFAAQLISKTETRRLSFEEAKPLIVDKLVQERSPDWQAHARNLLMEYTRSKADKIQIYVDRYKPLKDKYIVQPATSAGAESSGGGEAPPSGPPAAVEGSSGAPR